MPVIDDPALAAVLERSRSLGLLGPGDVATHVEHAEGFVVLTEGARRLLDLGSGGGLPGLVIAMRWPELTLTLLDAGERRVAFLRSAVRDLGVSDRVSVVLGRAEELAWDSDLRGQFDVVTARSFGPPAVTAECAAGFLSPGGRLLVSEPEHLPDRWPAAGLALVGLEAGQLYRSETGSIQELVARSVDLPGVPRKVGRPTRAPLF